MPSATQDSHGVDWDAVSVGVDDFVAAFVDEIIDDIVEAVKGWLEDGFDLLGDAYDAVTSLLADGERDIQALADIDFLLNEGQALLEEIQSAPDEVEDDEGEGGDDDGSSSAAAVGIPAGAARKADGTASVGFWPDIPAPDILVDAYEGLSSAAQDVVEEAYDNVEAFLDRIKDGIGALFGMVAEHVADLILAPLYQLGDMLADFLTTDEPGGVDFAFDFPGLTIDIPFSVSTPYVSAGDGANASADVASAPTDGAGSPSGAGAASTYEPAEAPGGHSKAATGSTVAPSDSFLDYLERAYGEVTGYVGSRTPITFDERNCRWARGPVYTMGWTIDLPDFVVNGLSLTNNAVTLWFGHEPGRPCTYTGVDPDATFNMSVSDVVDALQQNQAEAHAIASYAKDYAEGHRSRIEPILGPDSGEVSPDATPTMQEVYDVATTIHDDLTGLESEITAATDLGVDVSRVLEEMGVPDAAAEAATMQTRVEDAAEQLESSQLLEDLLAIHDAAADAGVSVPDELEKVRTLAGSGASTSASVDSTAAFELPDHLAQSAPTLAEWMAGLSSSDRSQLESASGVDLATVRGMLTDPGTPAFSIAESVREYVEEYVRFKLDQVVQAADEHLTINHEFTEGWDEWLCTGLCFNPLVATPIPVAAYWVAEELYPVALDLADDIIPDINLPGPFDITSPLAKLVLLVIVAVVFILLGALIAVVGLPSITLPSITVLGGASTAAIALMPIVILIVVTGNGEAIKDMIQDRLWGEQSDLRT